MALNNHAIPNETMSYAKLKDFPDGEEIRIVGVGIRAAAKYGDIPYFITAEGEELSLPSRYLHYVEDILEDEDAIEEISNGVTIVKGSRPTRTGGETPTFEYKK